MNENPILIVTGLSGSGKTTVLHTLEDVGYFCVDNLPVSLLSELISRCEQNEANHQIAVGIDIRGEAFRGIEPSGTIEEVRKNGSTVNILFLESTDSVLVRRFSETRRRHPLMDDDTNLLDGIAKERTSLQPMKDLATLVVDTSGLNVHQLRKQITDRFGSPTGQEMDIIITSFGFKYGLPPESDYVFDARFLPNPHFDDELQPHTGEHPDVRAFMESHPETSDFLSHIEGLLNYVVPQHEKEGKSSLTIAIGCTGGKHRSVYSANQIGTHLESIDYSIRVLHRDIQRT